MKIRALAAALAASTMVMAPVAAQAGTSASSMTPQVAYGNHATKSVKAKNKGAETIVLPVLAVTAVVVGGAVLIDDDKT